ncbi:MAG: D-alanyl-D-alanine carboxypeptidase/D-alanyl-D-alanine-endopeptidase [Verrucomicrobia bacterium]|nr:D-alanyl-D-alanine carboxypeptidase/D-alanyl-D-alanine-endopeptidase [Verrucomicrobiota bacterium]
MPFPLLSCRRVLVAVLLLPLTVAFAAEPPRTLPELRTRLEAHVSQPRFAGAMWGIKILSLDTGEVWFEHQSGKLLSPASNTKLYTGALALDVLGGDYRIRTPVLGTVAPDAAGVLPGSLVVSGRGDPGWRTRGGSRNFWDAFAPVVTVVRGAGIRRITGDVIADATWFHALPQGAGWTADDLNDYYGAEVSAISLEQNYAELRVSAAESAGGPARTEWLQPHTGLTVDNRVRTIPPGGTRRIIAQRLAGETTVHLFGEIPVGAEPEVVDVTVPRPAQWFAAGLREALIRAGITVEGQALSRRWPEAPADGLPGVRLGEVESAPLRALVRDFMKPSQNLETDLIFGHLAELRRTPELPEWRSTEDLGVAALREFLQRHGLPAGEVRFEEGSGLSRNNLTTAHATVSLLALMARHPAAEDFLAALPIAGVDGTIRRRMKGTVAEGNVRAKTGTLRYANALSGYVTTGAGERLAFSLMLNRNTGQPANRNVREELDDIAVWLAGVGRKEK